MQWIRLGTFNKKVSGSNPLARAVIPLGKALYPHCLVPWIGLKAASHVAASLQAALFHFEVAR